MQGKMKKLARLMQFIMKLKKLAVLSNEIRPASDTHPTGMVPSDVKEGHFAVLAGNGEEKKRFVVGLHHLQKPEFVRLLEMAREEYGFRNDGLLVIPCSPGELQKMLEQDL